MTDKERERLEIAVEMVFNELKYARELHPGWPKDILYAIAILNEEAGEATKAANDFVWHNGSIEQLKKELAQTGAMALRMLINLQIGVDYNAKS